MYLYRIISEKEWNETKRDKKVPRCKSDERDGCVHLTKFQDITVVANKYFDIKEQPVVLEVNIEGFEKSIFWKEATVEKPWQQPDAAIENIQWCNIKRYTYLKQHVEKEGKFTIGIFLNLDSEDEVDF